MGSRNARGAGTRGQRGMLPPCPNVKGAGVPMSLSCVFEKLYPGLLLSTLLLSIFTFYKH